MSISTKAMEGQDGFLFLNGLDANNLVDSLQGHRTISAAAIHVHEANTRVINDLDVPFVGIVVPEAHVTYPEKLPSGIAISAKRPVKQALAHMAKGYVYTETILREFRNKGGTVYTVRD